MVRKVAISQFLTEEEIKQAVKLYTEDPVHFHKRCVAEILKPNIRRINADLGQQNDAGYLAYMVEYVIVKTIIG